MPCKYNKKAIEILNFIILISKKKLLFIFSRNIEKIRRHNIIQTSVPIEKSMHDKYGEFDTFKLSKK